VHRVNKGAKTVDTPFQVSVHQLYSRSGHTHSHSFAASLVAAAASGLDIAAPAAAASGLDIAAPAAAAASGLDIHTAPVAAAHASGLDIAAPAAAASDLDIHTHKPVGYHPRCDVELICYNWPLKGLAVVVVLAVDGMCVVVLFLVAAALAVVLPVASV